MQSVKKQKLHYAWVILTCSILMAIAGFGVAGSITGNFVTPVVQEFGVSVSSFTMFTSVEAAAMAFLYIPASKVLTKHRIGHVMGIALIVQSVGIALMGIYSAVPLFYISGALLGVGAAFTRFTAIPILINMWFKKRAGFALGLTMSFGSLGGILFNYISAELITSCGWRNAYFILAAISAVISILPVMLLVKSPEEKGVLPYGMESNNAQASYVSETDSNLDWGPTKKEALRMPLFYIVWLTGICFSVGSCMAGYVANFTTMELGYSIKYGSLVSIAITLGTIICSSILGLLNDKFGVRAGLVWGVVFSVVGMSMMILSIKNHAILFPAAAVMGLGGALYTVQTPLIARSTLGGQHYASIWSVMMMGNSLAGALSFGPMGLFFDKTGSYRGAFMLCIVMFILSLILGWIAVGEGKKLKEGFSKN